MFIIKHKSRRRTGRAHTKNATFYYVVYAGADNETSLESFATDNLDDAAEGMNEALQYAYSVETPVKAFLTLWDIYKRSRPGAYKSI